MSFEFCACPRLCLAYASGSSTQRSARGSISLTKELESASSLIKGTRTIVSRCSAADAYRAANCRTHAIGVVAGFAVTDDHDPIARATCILSFKAGIASMFGSRSRHHDPAVLCGMETNLPNDERV